MPGHPAFLTRPCVLLATPLREYYPVAIVTMLRESFATADALRLSYLVTRFLPHVHDDICVPADLFLVLVLLISGRPYLLFLSLPVRLFARSSVLCSLSPFLPFFYSTF